MIDQSLLDYIKKQRDLGASDDQIRHTLEGNGWRVDDIDSAMGPKGLITKGDIAGDLPPAKQLLSSTLHIYGDQFWMFIGLILLSGIAAVVAIGLAVGLGVASVAVLGSNPLGMVVAVVLAISAVIVAIYVGIWGQAAILVALRDRHSHPGLRESFRRSRSLIRPFFITSLI